MGGGQNLKFHKMGFAVKNGFFEEFSFGSYIGCAEVSIFVIVFFKFWFTYPFYTTPLPEIR